MSSQQLELNKKNSLKQLATLASIATAAILCLIKLAAAFYTGSLSVLSSMIDSMSDVFSSFISFIAVRFSSKAANEKHRYGYGKAEALSALFQSCFVAASGLFVIYEGIKRFFIPRELADTNIGLLVMIFSLVATLILISFQRYVVKKTDSLAVSADSMHYVVDVATNASVIATLVVVKLFEAYWFDTLAAVFVSIYLLKNAYELACEAVSMLMDRELPHEIRQNVESVVLEHGFVKGIHDLRTRDLGGIYMFEFHLELDGNLSLYETHELSNAVEESLQKVYPSSQIVVHQDPAGLKEDRLDNKLESKK